MKEYLPLVGAYLTGLFSFLVAVWNGARTAMTNTELEKLKSQLAAESAMRVDAQKHAHAHRSAVDLANRRSKLERINLQLKNLYGPLYALSHASHQAWLMFRKVHRPGEVPYWPLNTDIDEGDKRAWRLWMSTVFMPLNVDMERLVLANLDLVVGDRMEDCLVDLCAHVEAYKTVVERWKNNDFSVHFTPLNFPGEALRHYVAATYRDLKIEQEVLLADAYEPQPIG